MLKVVGLRADYQQNPVGIVRPPQLGWKIESDRNNTVQKSYAVQVAADPRFSEVLFDSGAVESGESAQVGLNMELASSTRYFFRVRITDNFGRQSEWSVPAWFETALLTQAEWQAKFISAESEDNAEKSDTRYLRREFILKKGVVSATLYATALGLYELHINGKRVGDGRLTPGWTSYNKHLLYQTFDVTGLLRDGPNAVGALLGAGWYKGDMGFKRRRNHYGRRTALLCQMKIRYSDGTESIVISDESWKGSPAPITFAEIYDGECYDARLEADGWSEPGFDDAHWRPVEEVEYDKSLLTAQTGCLVKEIETLPGKRLFRTPEGDLVLDFGQNLSGWVRFSVKGNRGDRVVLKHAEILDAAGNFYTENLRTAKETIVYTLKGGGCETFEPHFTFQGFRYVKIEEFPGEPAAENFTAVVLHSDMELTGTFACSNPDINQLQHNILWGMKGNFIDVPTDCPQRDERLGWTGDAQIFARTACYLMNTDPFYRKWLRDLKHDQFPDGGVPFVVPDILTGTMDDDPISQGAKVSAAWGDAAVIIPWTLYLCYGDRRVLEDQYASMRAWVEYVRSQAQGETLWKTGFQYGDWVALDAEEGSYLGATPNDLVATAYYAYSTGILAKTAGVLNKNEDAAAYDALYRRIVTAFQREYFTPSGTLAARTQTAHILALMFDLTPEAYREQTVQTLLDLLEEHGGHLVTGFVGTPYFCHVLSRNGCTRQAYDLLLKDDFPSWLYQVKQGATTVWEHWDGLKPDGSMWSPDMNSFNHYAYGAVGDWLYRVSAGIEIDESAPGYKHFFLNPHIGGQLGFVTATCESPYGTIRSHWEIAGQDVTFEFTIPANTSATVMLENAEAILATGGLSFSSAANGWIAEVDSGSYCVRYRAGSIDG